MSDSDTMKADRLTSEEVLSMVGNEIRSSILRALWTSPDEWVSFSELRRRAGSPDSGQFNYHLNELLGTLVERTDEGYRPTHTGTQVLHAVIGGTTDDAPTLDTFALDDACPYCDGGLEASYDGENAVVRCGTCGKIQLKEAVPPTAFAERTPEETVRAFDRWVLARSLLMVEGICPNCAGKPETTLFQTRTARNGSLNYLRARHACGNCGYDCDVPIWLHVLLTRHPAVVSFYYDRGVDLGQAPVWELTSYGKGASVTLESEAPLGIGVEFTFDGDTLRLTLDDDLTIVEATPHHGAAQLVDD